MDIRRCATAVVGLPVAIVASVIACAITPIVGIVALPIFAVKALCSGKSYKSLWQKTFTTGTIGVRDTKTFGRIEAFGRIRFQDYTSWNGKFDERNSRFTSSLGSSTSSHGKDSYAHGLTRTPKNSSPDSPFKTADDLTWLQAEKTRLTQKTRYQKDLNKLKACAKALIPIIGLIWIVRTAIQNQQSKGITCTCTGEWDNLHWTRKSALTFHIRAVEAHLEKQRAQLIESSPHFDLKPVAD
ncbi:MAG: hypothetical protein H0X51_04390 [Parachlamydiaceae bacterium]|nr:hypothetical protein [Parachlamydiaceae bacterium]